MLVKKLITQIEAVAAQDPARPAIYDGDKVVSYAELLNSIRRMTEALRRHNLGEGDHVGLLDGNSVLAFSTIHATALLGATYVPLSPEDPAERLRALITDAGLKVMVCPAGAKNAIGEIFGSKAAGVHPDFIFADESPADVTNGGLSLSGIKGDDSLYMLFTSGSTGKPKGVRITHDCADNFCDWACKYLNVRNDDIFLAHTKLTFDLSVLHLFVPFLAGAAVRLVKSPIEHMNPGPLFTRDVSIALIVPRVTTLMSEGRQFRPGAFPGLRHLLFCGEKLLASHVNPWLDSAPSVQVHNIYGPTEATVACTYYSLPKGQKAADPIPIGTPMPNMQMLIDGGEEGELIIAGRQVTPLGYWKMKSDRFFSDSKHGPCFRSGDLVRRNSSGELLWLSRLDDQVKIKGHRVEPGEIEAVLSQAAGVTDVVCVFDANSEALTAVFRAADDSKKSDFEETFRRLCSERLPAYMHPAKYLLVQKIPKTPNGKIDRKALTHQISQK